MDRRKFCLSSAAAAISGAAAALAGAPAAGQMIPAIPAPAPNLPLYKFIYDRRYPAARAFGAAANGLRTVAIDGDITALWSRDLRAQWSAGAGAIAGMTTARSLFCLEQLAKDHWMRVVIRAEHAVEAHETTHRVTASAPDDCPNEIGADSGELAGENADRAAGLSGCGRSAAADLRD